MQLLKIISSIALIVLAVWVAYDAWQNTTRAAEDRICQIYSDRLYTGDPGTIVGAYGRGDAVIFADESNVSSELKRYLGEDQGHELFYDAFWARRISSVRVPSGCELEIYPSLSVAAGAQPTVFSFKKDTDWVGAEADDTSMVAVCSCD